MVICRVGAVFGKGLMAEMSPAGTEESVKSKINKEF
jgi:hypothetical protein